MQAAAREVVAAAVLGKQRTPYTYNGRSWAAASLRASARGRTPARSPHTACRTSCRGRISAFPPGWAQVGCTVRDQRARRDGQWRERALRSNRPLRTRPKRTRSSERRGSRRCAQRKGGHCKRAPQRWRCPLARRRA
eukprot:scaffold186528_cov30-Tisochrysis_lutea.AAC.3